jgi:Domain of unknown function (DUF4416)
MGNAMAFTAEKLVVGVLTSRADRREEISAALSTLWGPADFSCEPFPFSFTDYYNDEMGVPIMRFFLSFDRLVDPSRLAAIKKETNVIEERFREDGKRKVNLDPGLLALSRFTLATTKENAHRIPLADGIFAEITLLYHKGGFQPLPWTYPDFRSERYLAILNGIRARYKTQLGSR